jgi:pimeloyl-ACP methyl ester carboxylesterase
MTRATRQLQRLTSSVVLATAILGLGASSAAATKVSVGWLKSATSPGTPAKYDKVGVVKVGNPKAANVIVFEPGTSAGGGYFVPMAKWIVSKDPNWQVWSVERRENLLEDQSELNLAKQGKANGTQLYDYYLGFIKDKSIKHHFQFIPDSSVQYAKQWGMKVAVDDLHQVIGAALKLGGKVVLAGHSLGGSVVTAYATWDFRGHAGAAPLAGLIYIDGGSRPAVTAAAASSGLQTLNAGSSPWLNFGGIAAPFAGLFNATGATGALIDPNAPSLGQSSGLLPADIVPPVKVTNLGQYGYALNTKTSPAGLIAAQAHLGTGVSNKTFNGYHGWNGAGALTPIKRFAMMFSGTGLKSIDGTEWYFPSRLTLDTEAVGNGLANPAQKVLDVDATEGRQLPHSLRIYAFGAALGGQGVLDAAKALAAQSHIPSSHLTLVNRHSTYAHNDPAGAYPKNVFFNNLLPFLAKLEPKVFTLRPRVG